MLKSWREQVPERLTERGWNAGEEDTASGPGREGWRTPEQIVCGAFCGCHWFFMVNPGMEGSRDALFPTRAKMLSCSVLSLICILGRFSR